MYPQTVPQDFAAGDVGKFHTSAFVCAIMVNMSLPKSEARRVSASEHALLRSKTALDLKDRGDYAGALESMRPLLKRVGERPKTDGLDPAAAAEVLLCAGVLTSWIGSKNQIRDAQKLARDLINESVVYFESSKDLARVAVAQSEIAFCHYREGTLNEARSQLRDALTKLPFENAARARALLKLSTVECAAGRYHEALELLDNNEALFQKVTNHTIKGGYHSEMAIVLRNLGTTENRPAHFRRAINEYKKSENEFKLAHHQLYRADVINNVGFLLFKLSRYKEAHKYLSQARRLVSRFKDKARTAQVDESRAQVMIAEKRLAEAARTAHRAAAALEKSGQFFLMAEALTTQGIALARLGRMAQAHSVFRRAIEAANQVNASKTAGVAALTLIEETKDLPPETLRAAYRQAREWLATSQSSDLKLRLADVADRVAASVQTELSAAEATEILLSEPGGLRAQLERHEGIVIKRALDQVDGRVTHAASLLEMNYQSLAYIIERRHPELLKKRTPIKRRQRQK
jgi:tetratricopeptide (TPR) repeat protein